MRETAERAVGRVSMGNNHITIKPDSHDSADGRALIAQLDAELNERYPAEAIHALHPTDVLGSTLSFVIGRIGGKAVACGALRYLEPGVGEVKRMYVVPAFRGRGLSRQILAALEELARAVGYSMLRLETGIRQPEALGLYRAAGYREIPPFGEYTSNKYSVCFEKPLGRSLLRTGVEL